MINLQDDFSQEALRLVDMFYKILSNKRAIKFVGEGMYEFDASEMKLYFWYPGVQEYVVWASRDIESVDDIISIEGDIFHNGHSGRSMYWESRNGIRKSKIVE